MYYFRKLDVLQGLVYHPRFTAVAETYGAPDGADGEAGTGFSETRIAAIETKVQCISAEDSDAEDLFFRGCNVHIETYSSNSECGLRNCMAPPI